MQELIEFIKSNFHSKEDFKIKNRKLFKTIMKHYPLSINEAFPKKNKYDLMYCKLQALKFTNREDFRRKDKTTYNVIYAKGWGQQCLSHMETFKGEKRDYRNIRCLPYDVIFSNIKEASEILEISSRDIKNVLSGRQKSTKGFIFIS